MTKGKEYDDSQTESDSLGFDHRGGPGPGGFAGLQTEHSHEENDHDKQCQRSHQGL
jgi:hypothetical protein